MEQELSLWSAVLLGILILFAALLYSSVGHAGASGYLAGMALFGLPPAMMKPTALALNILVATIGTIKFARADCFSWRLFWPFAVTSVPFAFLGGTLALPVEVYKRILGLVLLYGAYHLFRHVQASGTNSTRVLPIWLGIVLGTAIGFLAGLTGVGGGIFLTPLLLLMRWAEPRQAAGVSVAFILVNSIAGLSGHLTHAMTLPAHLPMWAVAAAGGGWVGAECGSRRFSGPTIRRVLALVLVIAGFKMLLA